MPPRPPSDLRVRLLRNHILAVFLQVVATVLALFVITRVVVPWLVDRQDTALLWFAGALVLACPLLLAQLVYALWIGRRRLRARLQAARDAELASAPFGGLLN